MIRLYTGKLGAGKTYCAVFDLWDMLRNLEYNCAVVTNIEDIKMEDNRIEVVTSNLNSTSKQWEINEDALFFDWNHFEEFCSSVRERHKLHPKDKVYFIMDEAQRFLPPRKVGTNISYSFEYSRHIGVEFWLITQDRRKIDQSILVLCEEEIAAVNPRSNLVPKKFIYNRIIEGEILNKKILPKKDEVFALYKSFTAGKVEKKMNPTVYIFVALVLLTIAMGYNAFNVFTPGRAQANLSSSAAEPPKPSPAARPGRPVQIDLQPGAPAALVAERMNRTRPNLPKVKPLKKFRTPVDTQTSLSYATEPFTLEHGGRIPIIVGFDHDRKEILFKDGYPAPRVSLTHFLNLFMVHGYGGGYIGDRFTLIDHAGRKFSVRRGERCFPFACTIPAPRQDSLEAQESGKAPSSGISIPDTISSFVSDSGIKGDLR